MIYSNKTSGIKIERNGKFRREISNFGLPCNGSLLSQSFSKKTVR